MLKRYCRVYKTCFLQCDPLLFFKCTENDKHEIAQKWDWLSLVYRTGFIIV